MRAVIGRMFGHEVKVEAFAGEGADGPVFAASAMVRCRVNDGRRYAPGADRTEVLAETVIYMPTGTVCPAGSRVTMPDGRTTLVSRSSPRNGGILPTPAHLEVVVQ